MLSIVSVFSLLISVFHHNAEHWAVVVRVEILNDVFYGRRVDEFMCMIHDRDVEKIVIKWKKV